MPSLARILSLVVPLVMVQCLANPMPMPMPMRVASYRSKDVLARTGTVKTFRRIEHTTTIHESTQTEVERDSVHPEPTQGLLAPVDTRDINVNDLAQNINLLNTYYLNAAGNSENLRRYAAQSASRQDDAAGFQKQCASELTAFHSNMLGFENVFATLDGDKGLADYDRQNDVETLLKNIVNANKETFKAIDVLVYNIPGLGPILGPIVYEIKCLIEDLLNLTEDFTDAIINALQPLLKALIGTATTTTCSTGVEVADLCI